MVLRQHQGSPCPSASSHADSQMQVKPFFSSIPDDRAMCLDLKDLQVLLSKQREAWSLCSAGEKLTPETQDRLPSFSLPSTLFALPSLAVPLVGVTRKDACGLLVLPVTGKRC